MNYVLAYARVGEKMYDRRRGMEYSKYAVHTEKLLLELGWISKWRSWRNLAIRFTMSVILPRKLSHWIFRTFLRKRRMCQEIQECGDIPVEVFTGPFQRAAGG